MFCPNKVLSGSVIFLWLSLLFSCSHTDHQNFFREGDFNGDWKFQMGEIPNGVLSDLDDSGWKTVHLPHDWSIQDYEVQDSLHQGPFYKDLTAGRDVGYLRDGVAWYRKDYKTPAKLGKKHVILDFDGVQTQMELWVNGELMGEHVYGYTPFKFDITPTLHEAGEINHIAVKTSNSGENSRWFAGAGIYRPVHISILNPVSIAPWGVQITTPDISQESASVNFQVSIDKMPDEGVMGMRCRSGPIRRESKSGRG